MNWLHIFGVDIVVYRGMYLVMQSTQKIITPAQDVKRG